MPKQRDRFQEVLTAAIEDMMEHGFDSVERVQHWTRRLSEAADESTRMSDQDLAKMLREELARTYKKMVEDGGLLRFHPGVPLFTVEKLKPAMRSELDRRIMASADLIKLNRVQAKAKTLQRFQGWSTSIPPNGVSGEKKAAVKANVRKSLTSLPFEERRVLIDQGHKLTAAISEIVASDGGAIAGRWRSHWRQAGYDYREDHKERDEQVYVVRDSWAHQRGLVKKGGNPFYDEITAVGQEPFCRCYMIWLYNLRDLPKEMLTKKGEDALGEARAKAGRFADSEKAPKEQVDYVMAWTDPDTRCSRCSMFVPMSSGEVGNKCSAVEGTIDASAHCRLFKPARARADVAPKVGAAADLLRIERVRTLIADATSAVGLDLSR